MKPRLFFIHKNKDETSFDVVRKVKRALGTKEFGKIGHFGTLDPFAEGLLIIGTGGAQRLNELVHDSLPKTYLGTGRVGQKTDTADLTGKIIAENEKACLENLKTLELKDWQEASESFKSEYLQVPPQYSAVKHEGRALHKWAREGIKVEKPPKRRQIYDFSIHKVDFPFITFSVRVSSGTYIRTLFEDLCAKFQVEGHLTQLERTNIGEQKLELLVNSHEISRESLLANAGCISDILDFPKKVLNENQRADFLSGRSLSLAPLEAQKFRFWCLDEKGCLLGLGINKNNSVCPKIVFPQELVK